MFWLGTLPHKDVKNLKDCIRAALEAGYIGIDTAKVYGSRITVGKALKELNEEGVDVKVQTKIWTADFDKDINLVFNEMLKELNQTRVYSLLLHRPSLNFNDSIKAWKDIIKLKEKGLVDHIGVSNFDKDMIEILLQETGVKPEMNQIEMSISNFRHDRLDYNHKNGIKIQAWSPLGKNIVNNLNNKLVKKLSKKYNVPEGTILLSFLTSQEIEVIPGSSKPERVKTNAQVVMLTKDEIKALLEFNTYDNAYEETYPNPK